MLANELWEDLGEAKVRSLDPSFWICLKSGCEEIPKVFNGVELASGTRGKMLFWLFCTCENDLVGLLRAGPLSVESNEVCRVCDPR